MFSHHWLETCRRAAHDIGKILQFIWLRRLVFCSPYSIRCRNLAHQAKGWKKCIQLNTITCKMHIEIIVNHTKGVFLLDNLMKEVLILTKPLILSSIFFSFCQGTCGDNLSDVTDQPTGTMQNDVWQVFIVRHVLFHPWFKLKLFFQSLCWDKCTRGGNHLLNWTSYRRITSPPTVSCGYPARTQNRLLTSWAGTPQL